jgi:hypothetical protein
MYCSDTAKEIPLPVSPRALPALYIAQSSQARTDHPDNKRITAEVNFIPRS